METSTILDRLQVFNDQQQHLPEEIHHVLNDAVLAAYQKMVYASRDLLGGLDDSKHTKEQVKALISICPEALAQKDNFGHGLLPIQKAALHNSVDSNHAHACCRVDSGIPFIPMLAQEGIQRQIGGKDSRGGLLATYDSSSGSFDESSNGSEDYSEHDFNVIQKLCVQMKAKDNESMKRCLETIKTLISMNLLRKEDVIDHDLLYLSSWSFASGCNRSMLFSFLVNWNPEALKSFHRGQLPIHSAAEYNEESFRHILRAGVHYFADDLGFLFTRNDDNETAIARGIRTLKPNLLMNIVQQCIPPDANYPILHQVIRHEPQLIGHFSPRYPISMYKRDLDGRLPLHVALDCGMKWSVHLVLMINSTDNHVQKKKDPVTKLPLFLLAAAGENSDLMATYHLMRRHPDVLEKCFPGHY
uniref:Uncharacterized protein n=1 Tax=Chaetoceros debilis TaxID=122233 RepID=A0A7S3PV52_9STRA